MKTIKLLAIALTLIFSCNCAFGKDANKNFKPADVKAITAVMKKQAGNAVKYKVIVYEVFGDYAKAGVEVTSGGGDNAIAYLNKKGGEWNIINFGTMITEEELEGEVPQNIIDKFFGKNSSAKDVDTETIQPFGSFTWHDGLEDVIKKLNAIGTIETTEISNGSSAVNIDLKYTDNIKIENLIEDINKAQTSGRTGKYYNNGLAEDIIIGRYIKENDFRIYSSPVIINNEAYAIVITLKSNAGFAINHPDKVLIANDNIKYPLLIESVTLAPIKMDLNANKYRSTYKALYDKYSKFNPKSDAEYKSIFSNEKIGLRSMRMLGYIKKGPLAGHLAGSVFDRLHSCFSVLDGDSPGIRYISYAYHDAYQKIYDDRMQNIETNKNRGKADMKNAL